LAAVPSVNTLVAFAAVVMIFAAVPGPAVFYVVTRSVSQGRRAGGVSAAAVAAGNLVHVGAATVGLSALLASSAVAFSVVKYLGAGYLIYLGVRTLLSRDHRDPAPDRPAQPLPRVFREGMVVAVLNPKTALFFLAFLPQFVDPARGSATLQLAVLGLLLVAITVISDFSYAMVTGSAGAWLRDRTHVLRRSRFVTGGAYITLGVTAAVAGDRPQRG
jgi:threonine/homoserine/homoserine lactone efflux protein